MAVLPLISSAIPRRPAQPPRAARAGYAETAGVAVSFVITAALERAARWQARAGEHGRVRLPPGRPRTAADQQPNGFHGWVPLHHLERAVCGAPRVVAPNRRPATKARSQ
jgi:hypothetical protein